MNDLPLLNSERKEYESKLRQAREEKELISTVTLHEVTRIINTSEILTQEQRDILLKEIWRM